VPSGFWIGNRLAARTRSIASVVSAASMPHCESKLEAPRYDNARNARHRPVLTPPKREAVVVELFLNYLQPDRAGRERLATKNRLRRAPQAGCVLMTFPPFLGQHGGIPPDFSRMRVAGQGCRGSPPEEMFPVSVVWWPGMLGQAVGPGRTDPVITRPNCVNTPCVIILTSISTPQPRPWVCGAALSLVFSGKGAQKRLARSGLRCSRSEFTDSFLSD